jgi:hypothetical protein
MDLVTLDEEVILPSSLDVGSYKIQVLIEYDFYTAEIIMCLIII